MRSGPRAAGNAGRGEGAIRDAAEDFLPLADNAAAAVWDAGPQRPKRRLNLDKPIVASTGRPFTLTNEQIYDLIEFP